MARGSDPILGSIVEPAPPASSAGDEVTEIDEADLDVGDRTDPAVLDFSNLAVGDATELIADKVVLRRQARTRIPWLAGAVAAFAIAAGVTVAAPAPTSRAKPGAFEAEAAWLASTIDATARSARIRAYSAASLPMVQGAVLTDAATVQDLITSEMDLPVRDGETLELDQVAGTKRSTLLHWPATAPAIVRIGPDETRVEHDTRGGLSLVFAARVTPHDENTTQPVTGVLTLASPIDLAPMQQRLASIAVDVTLTGAGEPIVLVHGAGDAGRSVSVPVVPTSAQWNPGALTLTATPRITRVGWRNPLRYSLCGLGLALLAVFAIRGRTR